MTTPNGQFEELTDDQLDDVNGGKGIFEAVGSATGWYGSGVGKALDLTAAVTIGALPGIGNAYNIANAVVDIGTTAYGISQGTATYSELGAAVVGGIAAAAVPGLGVAEHLAGDLATTGTIQGVEAGVSQIVGATTFVGEQIVEHQEGVEGADAHPADSTAVGEHQDATGVDLGDHPADGADHSADGADHSADGADHSADGADHSADGADHSADGADHSADGADHSADGADHSADGADHSADGADHGADGADHSADGADHSADGADHSADGADGADHSGGQDTTASGGDHSSDGTDHSSDGSGQTFGNDTGDQNSGGGGDSGGGGGDGGGDFA
jgi:uncharacterized phage infection (PIP) family protein YhgE